MSDKPAPQFVHLLVAYSGKSCNIHGVHATVDGAKAAVGDIPGARWVNVDMFGGPEWAMKIPNVDIDYTITRRTVGA